ncbi:hypothetical protein [Bosea sp. Root670]|uniref:hypothetical protein n=1 Tax=Bosea sp. Root670 TaxID=1736583 RepID=UPI000AD00C82|nr:hypothetical protein [Bosea sp. Root670]
MCVRSACYLPSREATPSDYARALIVRRHLASLVEIGALATLLYAILIWSSVLSQA